eukprot:scaffold25619_cov137-Cylindrotheca_fusiformis.AAC.1
MPQQHPNVDDDDDTEDDDRASDGENRPDGLSDYELLRMRNIERNNARLASLGLLRQPSGGYPPGNHHPAQNRFKRRKKKPSRPSSTASTTIPLRRSTRSRRSVLDASTLKNHSIQEQTSTQVTAVEEPMEAEETYTVSPLFQYTMRDSNDDNESHANSKPQSEGKDPVDQSESLHGTSLSPVGPRLIPPKGLKAIYSLDFHTSRLQQNSQTSWLVGAGKAGIVALWDWSFSSSSSSSSLNDETGRDPILTWKAHSGRWIAEARFLPPFSSSSLLNNNKAAAAEMTTPSRLITAGNDGTVCLWDLSTVSVRSGVPKLVFQSGKSSSNDLHTSGIFAMDVLPTTNSPLIATGSKDKTVALSVLSDDDSSSIRTFWRSQFHSAKVGAVKLRGRNTCLLASASDDGYVCIHDYRSPPEGDGVVAQLDHAHERPHSVVWDPDNDHILLTAGLDNEIKLWDIRSTKDPVAVFRGHVPDATMRYKRIHHPVFYETNKMDSRCNSYILTGGEKSRSLSIFKNDASAAASNSNCSSSRFYSRGTLPMGCGDAGCIAVNGEKVAISLHDGEIMIMAPS